MAVAAARLRNDLSAAVLDAAVAALGYTLVLVLRFDGAVPGDWWVQHGRFLPAAVLSVLVVNAAAGLYGQVWRYASVLEARRVLTAGLASLLLITVVVAVTDLQSPYSVVTLGTLLVVGLHGALRFRARLFAFHRGSRDPGGLRVLVLGAGQAGSTLVRDMQGGSTRGLVPVAFLDDDPHLHGRLLHGVQVEGAIYELVRVAREHDAHQAFLAIRGAPQELVRTVSDLAEQAGVALRVLPAVDEPGARRAQVSDVRDLQITDLLGRAQVTTDLDAVRNLLHGRRVLVTGAGGSIGSEIARQVSQCGPAELVLLDNDETHLHDCAAGVTGGSVQALADVRERDAVQRAFRQHRPEVVFHAAALKHVPVLELHAAEAVKTNVLGTRNVIDAAVEAGVHRLVFISTDKAVRPSSVMGASKQVGEQLILQASGGERHYSAVRFGNVLGSRGSVIPTFMQQIQAGGPVTITDARMTRYFMSIPEAVQLVLQAATMSEGGEIFMLEMGEPVRIIDLATKMIRLSGRRVGEDIEVRVTGVRPGEKITEELHVPEESPERTAHPSIVRLRPLPPPSPDELQRAIDSLAVVAGYGLNDVLRSGLFALAQRTTWADGRSIVLPERRRSSDADDFLLGLTQEVIQWTSPRR